MSTKKNFLTDKKNIIITLLVFIAAILIYNLYFNPNLNNLNNQENQPDNEKNKIKKENESKANNNKNQETDYYQIIDDFYGVSLKTSNNFSRIDSIKLKQKNPTFIYGFIHKENPNFICYISKTLNQNKEEDLTPLVLKKAVEEKNKKIYPDLETVEAKSLNIGSDNKALKIFLNYTNPQTKTLMEKRELIGYTEKYLYVAYCDLAKETLANHKEDLEIFINNFKINEKN
jgi:hypothetical protein